MSEKENPQSWDYLKDRRVVPSGSHSSLNDLLNHEHGFLQMYLPGAHTLEVRTWDRMKDGTLLLTFEVRGRARSGPVWVGPGIWGDWEKLRELARYRLRLSVEETVGFEHLRHG